MTLETNKLVERLTARGSPFETVAASVEGVPCRVFRHAPRTLIDVYRRARSCGDREFLVTGARNVTHSEIFRVSARIAQVLRRSLENVQHERVALIFDNLPEWIASFVAITSMGATAVAVHRAQAPAAIAAAVEMTDCRLVICDGVVASALAGQVQGRPIIAIGPQGEDLGAAAKAACSDGGDELLQVDRVHPEQVAMIAFTSGSTNRPKGVELTHRSMTCGLMNALLGGALAMSRAAGPVQGAKGLPPVPFLAAPFSHVSGYGAILLAMYLGSRTVTMEKWDPSRAVELMLSHRATSLIGATSQMLSQLLEENVSSLREFVRSVVVQGTALPDSLLREVKSALPGIALGSGYGLTETNGSVCMGSEAILRELPNTSGHPLPTVDLSIQGSDGAEAAPGEVGEVTLRGAMLMRGYANLPEETSKALQGGWFRTGDLGWVDAQGFLYLMDRAERSVICGGAKVSCSAMEQVVIDNKLAAEAFAFGMREGDQEERLFLAVGGRREPPAQESAILRALRGAGYGVAPRIVRLKTSLPKTPSGKIDGSELRRRILATVEE